MIRPRLHLRSLLGAVVAGSLLVVPGIASAAPTIASVAPVKVRAGAQVVVHGAVDPAAPGEQVQVEQLVDDQWKVVAGPLVSGADGSWTARFVPRVGGLVRATQLTGTGGSSAETKISLLPRLLASRVQRGTIYPFLGAKASWRVAGGYTDGPARIELLIDGRRAGIVRTRIRGQHVDATLPVNGAGRFQARLVLPPRDGFAKVTFAPLRFTVRGERVGSGSSATWNRSLRAALRWRGFHVPGGTSFDYRMGDAVIAFHKAYGRSRTSTFEASDWTYLTQKKVAVRDRSRGLHIEIDKGRQILMQVKDGRPVMIVHVSTGATGNTPAGHWKVQWKGDWVPSLYGSLLYKSMSIVGAYAIHGYPSVPTSPASHGCVRVPMWIAARLYERSPVGTPIYIYEGPGSTQTSVGRGRRDVPELAGVDAARYADEV